MLSRKVHPYVAALLQTHEGSVEHRILQFQAGVVGCGVGSTGRCCFISSFFSSLVTTMLGKVMRVEETERHQSWEKEMKREYHFAFCQSSPLGSRGTTGEGCLDTGSFLLLVISFRKQGDDWRGVFGYWQLLTAFPQSCESNVASQQQIFQELRGILLLLPFMPLRLAFRCANKKYCSRNDSRAFLPSLENHT